MLTVIGADHPEMGFVLPGPDPLFYWPLCRECGNPIRDQTYVPLRFQPRFPPLASVAPLACALAGGIGPGRLWP
ncbi:hypothetical protein D3C80_988410 [compost metagenome]